MADENTNPTPNQEKEPKKGIFGGLLDKIKGGDKKADKPQEKGNALTEIMNQTEKKPGLVSNIIKNVKPKSEDGQTEVNKVMVRDSEAQLFWGRISSAGVLVFLLVSLALNWVWLNEDNPVLGMIGKENIIETNERVERQLKNITDKYNDLKEMNLALISQDSSEHAVISKEIVSSRVAWTEVIDQVDEVVMKVSPYNPVTNKLEVTQYNFSTDDNKVIIGGLIQNESEDKIYTLTANTVDALEESPYFEDVDYSQYSVSEENLGSFTSPLRAIFYIQESESNEDDSMNYLSTDYSKRRYRHDGYQFSTDLDDEDEEE